MICVRFHSSTGPDGRMQPPYACREKGCTGWADDCRFRVASEPNTAELLLVFVICVGMAVLLAWLFINGLSK
jgi:hypothetical protein